MINISDIKGPFNTQVITNTDGEVIGKIYSVRPRGIRLVSHISSPFINDLGGKNASKGFKTRSEAIKVANEIF